MLRRAGCLGLVVALVLVVPLGWFGYQTYLHVTDARAVDDRLSSLSGAWAADPAALSASRAAAVTGQGGDRPAAVPDTPLRRMGSLAVEAYDAAGRDLRIAIVRGECNVPVYDVELRESGQTVVVLVHPHNSWLPDLSGIRDIWGGQGCSAVGVFQAITVPLAAPLGKRVVVDGVSGAGVIRRPGLTVG